MEEVLDKSRESWEPSCVLWRDRISVRGSPMVDGRALLALHARESRKMEVSWWDLKVTRRQLGRVLSEGKSSLAQYSGWLRVLIFRGLPGVLKKLQLLLLGFLFAPLSGLSVLNPSPLMLSYYARWLTTVGCKGRGRWWVEALMSDVWMWRCEGSPPYGGSLVRRGDRATPHSYLCISVVAALPSRKAAFW